ncbi:DUF805 domain-containing protein [Hwangdonia lutea]|uniref:DUF805 domain-containing protein n=1 Tax=Hwangdonia lutea TaxID=3075823 RepID=A0AA97HQL3_9FLAO|nr:DUF805 domain-containing protein [Hwangdonia sp. SCSIO 19198]WOD42498.1 DUF805 domain-containing protein [Hwangdonia sp. SCSIO 19198]
MFKNILSSDGRIRRTEYCLTYLGYILIINGTAFLSGYYSFEYADYLEIAIIIPLFYILIVQGAKRCHDRGNSGWYQLIPFYQLWMFFADGNFGPNEYGNNPKGKGNHDEINEIGKQIENE